MTERVRANGLRFAYEEEGRGPLVLLLHGFPDTPQTWDRVRPALAEAGYRAVSPYLRGYAPTAIPDDGDYRADTLGRDAVALAEALSAPGEPAILVGHDWGASAAYSAATLAPQRVRRLITVGLPHPAALRPTPRVIWGLRHFFTLKRPDAAALVARNDFAYVDRLVQRWSPAWRVPPEETAAVKATFRRPGCLEAAIGYYRALRFRPPPSQRRRIRVPCVCFAGEQDGMLRDADYQRARRMFADDYRVVSLPGGHFLHREHPRRFIQALRSVLPRSAVSPGGLSQPPSPRE